MALSGERKISKRGVEWLDSSVARWLKSFSLQPKYLVTSSPSLADREPALMACGATTGL